jgi:hypothetical protein
LTSYGGSLSGLASFSMWPSPISRLSLGLAAILQFRRFYFYPEAPSAIGTGTPVSVRLRKLSSRIRLPAPLPAAGLRHRSSSYLHSPRGRLRITGLRRRSRWRQHHSSTIIQSGPRIDGRANRSPCISGFEAVDLK